MNERKEAVIDAVRGAKKRRSLGILSQITGISEKELNNIAERGDVSYANEIALASMLKDAHGPSLRAPFPSTWE